MGIRKPIREVDSILNILRRPSPKALERQEYIQQKKSAGCALCQSKARLNFYHRDPLERSFNVQETRLSVPQDDLDKELEKCVVLCVSCRMRVLSGSKSAIGITDKELYRAMQENYRTDEEDKSSKRPKAKSPAMRDVSYVVDIEVCKKVFHRDNNMCRYCSAPANEVDHLVPWSFGGLDTLDNLVACCDLCKPIAYGMMFAKFQDKKDYVRKRRRLRV